MFTQMTLNQNKGNGYEEEEPRHRRRSLAPTGQTEGWCSPQYNEDYYVPHPKNYHRPIYEPFPREPRIDLPPFYEKDNVEEFLD